MLRWCDRRHADELERYHATSRGEAERMQTLLAAPDLETARAAARR